MNTSLPLRFTLGLLLAAGGVASSAIAQISLGAQSASHLPIITAQPVSQTVRDGTRATFSVSVGGSGEITYRWYRGTQFLDNHNSPTLVIAAAREADAGVYHVEVSNASGSVTSGQATLTVNVSPPVLASAPTITLQPTSLVVNNGGSALFSVTASGDPVLSYQWMKNDLPVGGANSPTLALTGIKVTDAGAYSVRISNSHGAITSLPATLTVNVAVSLVLDQ